MPKGKTRDLDKRIALNRTTADVQHDRLAALDRIDRIEPKPVKVEEVYRGRKPTRRTA